MQTPGNEKELATGLLFAEDVIKDVEQIKWEQETNDNGVVDSINIITSESNLGDGIKSSRSLLSVSSCGICGKREIEDLMPNELALKQNYSIEFSRIEKLFTKMRSSQKIFEETGGCHGVAAFDHQDNMLAMHEDIGRHNALDKVVGSLLLSDKLKQAKIVTFSGRTSYEMVSKTFRAKIPIIASVSAPSSLSIDFAKEYGLTLVGFCRKNNATVYAGMERIIRS